MQDIRKPNAGIPGLALSLLAAAALSLSPVAGKQQSLSSSKDGKGYLSLGPPAHYTYGADSHWASARSACA